MPQATKVKHPQSNSSKVTRVHNFLLEKRTEQENLELIFEPLGAWAKGILNPILPGLFFEFPSLRGRGHKVPPRISRKVFTLLWWNLARFKHVISLTDWASDVSIVTFNEEVTMTSQSSHFEFWAAILNPEYAFIQLTMKNIWIWSKKHKSKQAQQSKGLSYCYKRREKAEKRLKRQKIVKTPPD